MGAILGGGVGGGASVLLTIAWYVWYRRRRARGHAKPTPKSPLASVPDVGAKAAGSNSPKVSPQPAWEDSQGSPRGEKQSQLESTAL